MAKYSETKQLHILFNKLKSCMYFKLINWTNILVNLSMKLTSLLVYLNWFIPFCFVCVCVSKQLFNFNWYVVCLMFILFQKELYTRNKIMDKLLKDQVLFCFATPCNPLHHSDCTALLGVMLIKKSTFNYPVWMNSCCLPACLLLFVSSLFFIWP